MSNIFKILGILCIVLAVLLSLYMHWCINHKTTQAEKLEKFIVRGSLVRTVLVVLGAAFFVATQI